MHPLTTVLDAAVAAGTLLLASATAAMAWQTRLLVQHGQQPVLVPDDGPVFAHYEFTPGGPLGFSTYRLPVRNVGQGVAIVQHMGSMLVDPRDPLTLAGGGVILGPGGGAVVEFRGTHQPHPAFEFRLLYSDVAGKRRSLTEIVYNFATDPPQDRGHADVVALKVTFRVRA